MEILSLELRKLGLREKEAQLYLAGLELGPCSAQSIARKTGISRPTAYELIKRLEQKGLFVETKEKKKRYFIAQSPDKILGILKLQKRAIEEKEREFIRIIAALESKYSLHGKGELKLYKGQEAVKVLLKETLAVTSSPEIFALDAQASPKQIKERQAIYQQIKKRLGKIEVKELYAQKSAIKKNPLYMQTKTLPYSNLKGALILFDKAILLSPNSGSKQKPEAYLIESKIITDLLKTLFQTLWALAKC